MLNEILKSLREQNRYSQTTLAKHLHITRQAYNHYETGKRIPSLETIKKLADFYGVSTDFFLSPAKNISVNKLTESEPFENIEGIDQDNIPLSEEEGALLLQEKLKGTPLVNEQGVITKEGADIFATFLINNADMLKKLLNDNK